MVGMITGAAFQFKGAFAALLAWAICRNEGNQYVTHGKYQMKRPVSPSMLASMDNEIGYMDNEIGYSIRMYK